VAAHRRLLGDSFQQPLGDGEIGIVRIRGGGLAPVLQRPWKLMAPLRFTVNKVAMGFKINDVILEVYALCSYAAGAAYRMALQGRRRRST
jgi:hypothetical protein